MQRARLILTDAAASRRKRSRSARPVLVLRDVPSGPKASRRARRCASAPTRPRILHAAAAHARRAAGAARCARTFMATAAPRERIIAGLLGRPVDEFARDWPRIEGLRRIG